MNIVAIIPSRYASTRLPAKPLADIGGKTMIQRVYERTQQASLVNDIIVATDDQRIVDAVRAFGGKVQITPADIQSGSDRIALVARSVKADMVVNVQGDEPLIDPKLIDQTIRALIDHKHAVVATAIKKISDYREIFNPNVVKAVVDKNNDALYFSRSPVPHLRDAKEEQEWLKGAAFYKHFGIYVYRAQFLQQFSFLEPTPLELSEKLEQLRVLEHGFTITCVPTEYESFPVDTPDDLEKIRELIKRKNR